MAALSPSQDQESRTVESSPPAYCPNCRARVALDAAACAACNAVFAPDGWGPVDAEGNYLTPHHELAPDAASRPEQVLFAWLRAMILYPAVLIAGGIYASAMHALFVSRYGGDGRSGVMLVSFLFGVPLLLCAVSAYVITRARKQPLSQALGFTGLMIGFFVFLAGVLLREGVICIAMAMPLFIAVGVIGGVIGWGIASADAKAAKRRTLCFALCLPALFGAAEERVVPPDRLIRTQRSIHVDAPAPVLWHLVNYPTGIRPAELKDGFAYRIGVPYPIEARTLEERKGGLRQLVWQRGVRFQEEITEFAPGRRIAWTYRFTPESFPAGSLDEHVTIGGLYFTLLDTAYTLTPEAGGTRLEIEVTSRVSTNFNWYAGAWAAFLIGDTAETILRFYKNRAERA